MPPTIASVHRKAQAFVEGLTRLPRSARAAVPHGHFARDYNTLRTLAMEVAPGVDERLLGQFIGLYETPGGEFSRATYVEIEVYARQIIEQLALLFGGPPAGGANGVSTNSMVRDPVKAYEVAAIRKEYSQAYAPWSEGDDEHLRGRYLEGATQDELIGELRRQPGAIRSRLRKLGLTQRRCLHDVSRQDSHAAQAHSAPEPDNELVQSVPEWKRLRPRAGKAWSAEEDAALLRDLQAGFSIEEIARTMGRGIFAVEVRLSKLGKSFTDGRDGPPERGEGNEKTDVERRPGDDDLESG